MRKFAFESPSNLTVIGLVVTAVCVLSHPSQSAAKEGTPNWWAERKRKQKSGVPGFGAKQVNYGEE